MLAEIIGKYVHEIVENSFDSVNGYHWYKTIKGIWS